MPAISRSGRSRRIGIFGGTFNPIHLAHLRSAEEVCERQQLDRVLFVPSAVPPHKGRAALAPAAHRLAMVRLAVARHPSFRVSTVEIERGGPSYSVETLRRLHAAMPGVRFTFILGLDAFREIGTWREYRQLFALCDFVVTSRPSIAVTAVRTALPVAARGEFCYRRQLKVLEHHTGHRIAFQRITDLDISASGIRDDLQHGRSIRYLVPPRVERYIQHHHLYARRTASH